MYLFYYNEIQKQFNSEYVQEMKISFETLLRIYNLPVHVLIK